HVERARERDCDGIDPFAESLRRLVDPAADLLERHAPVGSTHSLEEGLSDRRHRHAARISEDLVDRSRESALDRTDRVEIEAENAILPTDVDRRLASSCVWHRLPSRKACALSGPRPANDATGVTAERTSSPRR